MPISFWLDAMVWLSYKKLSEFDIGIINLKKKNYVKEQPGPWVLDNDLFSWGSALLSG